MTPRPRALSPHVLKAWSTVVGLADAEGLRDLPKPLCRGVVSLWERFTRARSHEGASYLDDAACRLAYLAYYFPVNLSKVQALLDEMPEPAGDCDGAAVSFSVLDLGSGPGTTALAVLDWARQHASVRRQRIHLVAVDRSPHALKDCQRFWTSYASLTEGEQAKLVTIRADIDRFNFAADPRVTGRAYDLIVLANTLDELFRRARHPIKRRTELLATLLNCLDERGTLMIIEPALRRTSRQLHEVRDALLKERLCTVYSPCLREETCPALIREDDWCHEERPWTPPPLVEAIDRQVGFIKDSLKFSYLLLRKDGKQIVPRSPTVYRVVSELREMKGEKRAWLCNETGRSEVGRLDRERSSTNEAFDDWHRGAIVRIDQIVRKHREADLGRIPDSATVEILRSV
jgi:ribosomal protein RSM22 (predicted rRNA methylase)